MKINEQILRKACAAVEKAFGCGSDGCSRVFYLAPMSADSSKCQVMKTPRNPTLKPRVEANKPSFLILMALVHGHKACLIVSDKGSDEALSPTHMDDESQSPTHAEPLMSFFGRAPGFANV